MTDERNNDIKVKSLNERIACKHILHDLKFIRNTDNFDEVMHIPKGVKSIWQCPDCGGYIMRTYKYDTGKISDGYHTFDELYHHRAILTACLFHDHKDICWKSKQHSDPNEPMYDGMFIVGINTPEGQATYHYDVDPYWDLFDVPELERAPKYDGHTPKQAITRIMSLLKLK